jgi:hypothetical protein
MMTVVGSMHIYTHTTKYTFTHTFAVVGCIYRCNISTHVRAISYNMHRRKYELVEMLGEKTTFYIKPGLNENVAVHTLVRLYRHA